MTRQRLRDLAASMNARNTRIPFRLMATPPGAHYTYLGQFVVHDLSHDTTVLAEAAKTDWKELSNKTTPWLDLDSVYGDGPGSRRHSHLYDTDGATFRLGHRSDGPVFDVPVGSNANDEWEPETIGQKALLADDRNNENAVIRQIHAIFLLLHNKAVEELRRKGDGCDLFERARQRVRWQYQWVVRHDLLRAVCQGTVYNTVVREGWTHISWGSEGFLIPVEFAHAAGRFGHSMVRDGYQLRRGQDQTSLEALMAEARSGSNLRPEFQIDWQVFRRVSAHSVDSTIAAPLFRLRHKSVPLSVASEHSSSAPSDSLPARTLQRGACLQLATGQQAAAAFGLGPTLDAFRGQTAGYTPFKDSDDLGFTGNLPLWYYILLEAELEMRGAALGPLGSTLVCEVIEGSLAHDPTSIVHQLRADPTWTPAPWETEDGKSIAAKSFLELTQVVGLARPARG